LTWPDGVHPLACSSQPCEGLPNGEWESFGIAFFKRQGFMFWVLGFYGLKNCGGGGILRHPPLGGPLSIEKPRGVKSLIYQGFGMFFFLDNVLDKIFLSTLLSKNSLAKI